MKDTSPTADVTRSSFSPANMNFQMGDNPDKTVQRILSTYEIGARLRALRLRKKIALVDLGKHTGLSASMLSQLETGKMVPTLPTLVRIAMVFDVGLEYFFDDRSRRKTFTVVRRGERIRFPDRADSESPSWFFECLAFSATEKNMQAYLAEFPLREPQDVRPHSHDGSEFIYVTRGQLFISCHGEDFELSPGDSVYFDSSESHSYWSTSEDGAQAVVVTTSPRG